MNGNLVCRESLGYPLVSVNARAAKYFSSPCKCCGDQHGLLTARDGEKGLTIVARCPLITNLKIKGTEEKEWGCNLSYAVSAKDLLSRYQFNMRNVSAILNQMEDLGLGKTIGIQGMSEFARKVYELCFEHHENRAEKELRKLMKIPVKEHPHEIGSIVPNGWPKLQLEKWQDQNGRFCPIKLIKWCQYDELKARQTLNILFRTKQIQAEKKSSLRRRITAECHEHRRNMRERTERHLPEEESISLRKLGRQHQVRREMGKQMEEEYGQSEETMDTEGMARRILVMISLSILMLLLIHLSMTPIEEKL